MLRKQIFTLTWVKIGNELGKICLESGMWSGPVTEVKHTKTWAVSTVICDFSREHCEVKCALGSITMSKASGGDGIPVELVQILKDDAVNVLHSIFPANLENSAVATGLENVIFHSNLKEGQCQRMFKLPHNCTHLTC